MLALCGSLLLICADLLAPLSADAWVVAALLLYKAYSVSGNVRVPIMGILLAAAVPVAGLTWAEGLIPFGGLG